MFRIVAVDSPDFDGLLVPEDMEDDPDDPSAEFGRSTGVDGTHKELLPSHSTTSLASALQASLSSSASLQEEEFYECLNTNADENDRNVGGGNPLLDYLAACNDDDDDSAEEPHIRSGDSPMQPAVTAPASPMHASERRASDGTSDSVVPASATSLQVTFSAHWILSRGAALVASAAGLAVRTAFLPVTLPLHLTGSLLGRAVGGADDPPPPQSSSVMAHEDDDEDGSSEGSTQPALAEGRYGALTDGEVTDELNGVGEKEVGAWTTPLEAAMKMALFPLTAPMFLASAATSAAVNGCSAAVSTTASLLEQALRMGTDATAPGAKAELKLISQPSPSSSSGMTGVLGISDTMKDVTVKVLSDLSCLLDSLSPTLRHTWIDPRKEDRMLDRLRLDFHLENPSVLDAVAYPVLPVTPACSFYSAASSMHNTSEPQLPRVLSPAEQPCPRSVSPRVSGALLRVDDLGIYRMDPAKEAMLMSRLCYLDLNDDLGTELGDEAMSRLIGRCLGLVSNLPEARLQSTVHYHISPKSIVDWRPERGSSELMGKLSKLSKAERVVELQTQTLVWSGQFRHPDGRGNKPFPLFASRGIIPWKPLDFVSLMWDDARVQVYNKLCAGRSSVRVFRDEIDAGGSRGTKIVEFTTRVPLTNFTVSMTSIMHVAPIQTRNEDDAFIIISRSVFSGRSGAHFESHDHVERSGNKSEIIWGVNIVQPVPNQLHLTDLTSISQVGTTMVPNILARKIGLWGVEDFYKNVRSHNS